MSEKRDLKLSANLRKVIRDREMTVASLSRLSGVPKTNIQGWLEGASPNILQLQQVAAVLHLNIEELAFGKRSIPQFDQVIEQLNFSTGKYEISIRKIEK
jgi:predicted transcriptional regulator